MEGICDRPDYGFVFDDKCEVRVACALPGERVTPWIWKLWRVWVQCAVKRGVVGDTSFQSFNIVLADGTAQDEKAIFVVLRKLLFCEHRKGPSPSSQL